MSSDLLAADQWAEGLPGVRHEGLDLVHATWHAGQELNAVPRHGNVVLDAHLDHNNNPINNNNHINNNNQPHRSLSGLVARCEHNSSEGSWHFIEGVYWNIWYTRRLSYWLISYWLMNEKNFDIWPEKKGQTSSEFSVCALGWMRVFGCSTAACIWYSLSNTSKTIIHANLLRWTCIVYASLIRWRLLHQHCQRQWV